MTAPRVELLQVQDKEGPEFGVKSRPMRVRDPSPAGGVRPLTLVPVDSAPWRGERGDRDCNCFEKSCSKGRGEAAELGVGRREGCSDEAGV